MSTKKKWFKSICILLIFGMISCLCACGKTEYKRANWYELTGKYKNKSIDLRYKLPKDKKTKFGERGLIFSDDEFYNGINEDVSILFDSGEKGAVNGGVLVFELDKCEEMSILYDAMGLDGTVINIDATEEKFVTSIMRYFLKGFNINPKVATLEYSEITQEKFAKEKYTVQSAMLQGTDADGNSAAIDVRFRVRRKDDLMICVWAFGFSLTPEDATAIIDAWQKPFKNA